MGNVNMPMPLALAGGALCVLGGYLMGVVLGPQPADQDTAEVVSYEPGAEELCLTGESVADVPQAEEGVLCGTWRHSNDAEPPEEGEAFRFVVMTSDNNAGESATFIYGDVVR